MSRIKIEGPQHLYQGVVLQGLRLYSSSLVQECGMCAELDLKKLDQKMRSRLEWSDVEMLRSIITFADTQSWTVNLNHDSVDVDDISEILSSVEYITAHFRDPLLAVGTNLATIRDEVEEAVEYARKYLSIRSETCQTIWYKLHEAPDAQKWPNVLILAELIFSLPFSNGKVERIFSVMKIIKTDRRTNLHIDTLDNLLEIQMEGPPLSSFSATEAVHLWWDDCRTTRRVNQEARKPYKPRISSASQDETSEPDSVSLALSAGTTGFVVDMLTVVITVVIS